MRRRTAFILAPLAVLVLLLLAAGAAAHWRIPLAERAVAVYAEHRYGVPVAITISELGTTTARIDHVKVGESAPFEADDIRIDYDLQGQIKLVAVRKVSAHGKIEGGTVTLGDLQPLLESGDGNSQTSRATLPHAIAVDRLDLDLETPMGGVAVGGSARLGQGALALDLTATDPG